MADKNIKWLSSIECDFCHKKCEHTLVDAITKYGCWATMCFDCWSLYGIGKLGTGFGQLYKKDSDNNFVKVKG